MKKILAIGLLALGGNLHAAGVAGASAAAITSYVKPGMVLVDPCGCSHAITSVIRARNLITNHCSSRCVETEVETVIKDALSVKSCLARAWTKFAEPCSRRDVHTCTGMAGTEPHSFIAPGIVVMTAKLTPLAKLLVIGSVATSVAGLALWKKQLIVQEVQKLTTRFAWYCDMPVIG